jgi:hypothetical protein
MMKIRRVVVALGSRWPLGFIGMNGLAYRHARSFTTAS